MRRVVECDVCIIGSGISAAMVAEKLADERNARVVVVEAGDEMPGVDAWYRLRRRFLDYLQRKDLEGYRALIKELGLRR